MANNSLGAVLGIGVLGVVGAIAAVAIAHPFRRMNG